MYNFNLINWNSLNMQCVYLLDVFRGGNSGSIRVENWAQEMLKVTSRATKLERLHIRLQACRTCSAGSWLIGCIHSQHVHACQLTVGSRETVSSSVFLQYWWHRYSLIVNWFSLLRDIIGRVLGCFWWMGGNKFGSSWFGLLQGWANGRSRAKVNI